MCCLPSHDHHDSSLRIWLLGSQGFKRSHSDEARPLRVVHQVGVLSSSGHKMPSEDDQDASREMVLSSAGGARS